MVLADADGTDKVWLIGLWYDDELVRTADGWRFASRTPGALLQRRRAAGHARLGASVDRRFVRVERARDRTSRSSRSTGPSG